MALPPPASGWPCAAFRALRPSLCVPRAGAPAPAHHPRASRAPRAALPPRLGRGSWALAVQAAAAGEVRPPAAGRVRRPRDGRALPSSRSLDRLPAWEEARPSSAASSRCAPAPWQRRSSAAAPPRARPTAIEHQHKPLLLARPDQRAGKVEIDVRDVQRLRHAAIAAIPLQHGEDLLGAHLRGCRGHGHSERAASILSRRASSRSAAESDSVARSSNQASEAGAPAIPRAPGYTRAGVCGRRTGCEPCG